jgi:hypothetical protein
LAEAKVLQNRYGIALKDAFHRLYMSEISKLETLDTAEKTMAAIHCRLDKTRSDETMDPIASIDAGLFDDYVLPHGRWPGSEEGVIEGSAMELA